MNDDREFTRIAAAASSTEGERRTSFREEIERLFAEYAASLRNILGFREVTAQREQESTGSRSSRWKSPTEKQTEGSRRTTPEANVNEQEAPCESQSD